MLLRRENARNADFVVLFEPRRGKSQVRKFERVKVRSENGKKSEGAVGLDVSLGSKNYRIVLNPLEETVNIGDRSTEEIITVTTQ